MKNSTEMEREIDSCFAVFCPHESPVGSILDAVGDRLPLLEVLNSLANLAIAFHADWLEAQGEELSGGDQDSYYKVVQNFADRIVEADKQREMAVAGDILQ